MSNITNPEARRLRGQIAYASRKEELAKDPQRVENLRRDLRAVNLEQAVREVVEAAPPLTDEQRHAIARLLIGGAA